MKKVIALLTLLALPAYAATVQREVPPALMSEIAEFRVTIVNMNSTVDEELVLLYDGRACNVGVRYPLAPDVYRVCINAYGKTDNKLDEDCQLYSEKAVQ